MVNEHTNKTLKCPGNGEEEKYMKEKMKNTIRRVLSVVAALAMVVGLVGMNGTPVMAAGTGTITIQVPNGTPHNANNTYTIYKIFDGDSNGTSMSYRLPAGKSTNDLEWTNASMSTYFNVDEAGNVSATNQAKDTSNTANLSAAAVSAIKNYVDALLKTSPASITPVATVTPIYDSTSSTWTSNTASGLENGYYYITTTTGSAVIIDSAKPDVTVTDKTEVPTIDKTITGVKQSTTDTTTNAGSVKEGGKSALAEVGSIVSFKAEITIGKNVVNYIMEDTLPKDNEGNYQLKLVGGSGRVYKDSVSPDNIVSNTNNSAYTFFETPDDSDSWTFQVVFKNEYTSTLAQGTKLIVTYDTYVTSASLQDSPAENSAVVIWGDPHHSNTSQPSKTSTYNAKITVTKNFQGLAGENTLSNDDKAEFVLTRTSGGTTQYYKIVTDTEGAVGKSDVTWVNTVDDATKISFNKTGESHEFAGLADGTYVLTESRVPAGYNKAPDQTITIKDANSDNPYVTENLNKSATFENNTGSLLPSTGGVGTTIFYVIGGAVVAGAVILLIARRKKNA